jgi:hypothetical protein
MRRIIFVGKFEQQGRQSMNCKVHLSTFVPLHAVAQWLRYSATNRKVAGSISEGVIGIFY